MERALRAYYEALDMYGRGLVTREVVLEAERVLEQAEAAWYWPDTYHWWA